MKEEYLGDYEELHIKMKILFNLGFKCSTAEFKVIYILSLLCLQIHFLGKGVEEKQRII